MSTAAVEAYLAEGFPHVEGWLSPHIMRLVGLFGEEMNRIGVFGGACEIGVFQGKFMIGLSHAVDGRASLAIDIFNEQQFNVDNSGGGTSDLLGRFRQNVAKHAPGPIEEMNRDSLTLTQADGQQISERFGKFQFVSIDGGHEPEHVVSDYHFSESIIHPGGTMIIDDFLNPGWPGVLEGVATLYLLGRPKFVPLAIGHNKLFLVSKSYHKAYFVSLMQRFKTSLPQSHFGRKVLFGHEVIVLN